MNIILIFEEEQRLRLKFCLKTLILLQLLFYEPLCSRTFTKYLLLVDISITVALVGKTDDVIAPAAPGFKKSKLFY